MIRTLNELYLKNNKPLSLKLEITNMCNLKCVHCYARSKQIVFLDKEYIFNILKQAKELGVIFLHITGGECLIHPDFREIYTYAYKLGFKIIILTNGTLITDDLVKLFSSKRPYLIEISIYGISQDICYAVTGNKDAYKHTFSNIQKLKAQKLNILLKYILININKNSLIPFIIFSQCENFNYKIYYNIMPTKNNDNWINLQIEPFIKELLNLYTLKDYISNMEDNTKKSFKECNAAKSFFNINCYGKLYFCDFLDEISENVIDLQDAIISLQKKTNVYFKNLDIEKCKKCTKTTVCDTCIASISDKLKFSDSCYTASYRYEIKKQLKELREL